MARLVSFAALHGRLGGDGLNGIAGRLGRLERRANPNGLMRMIHVIGGLPCSEAELTAFSPRKG
jgi:hypothetical protein